MMTDYTNLEDALEALEAAEAALQQADEELEDLRIEVGEWEAAHGSAVEEADRHESLADELMGFIVHELDNETHCHLVENFTVPTQVLGEIVRKRFASPELLTLLADEREWTVRSVVTQHDNTPVEILTRLASDGHVLVRRSVATRSSLTPELFTLLAKDKDKDVRERVASHPAVPLSVLDNLLKDRKKSVRKQVVKALKTRTNMELVEVLNNHGYEEATVDLPREWLLNLLATV